ncbi:MAG: Adenylosuccinate synthetase [Dehalococcoides mccartyi]|nr:Adenylosuccinate synthetase [Dehalococcoides mccartyi]
MCAAKIGGVMPVTAIVGGPWGDEGKGKVVDMLAQEADYVVRFSGGDNAGHTVINPMGEFKLHIIPSGVFYPGVKCIIGNGVVINPDVFIRERNELISRGVDVKNVFISDRAHLVLPYHILLDGLEEEARGNKSLGTTRRGIGPAFVDKYARMGIRVGDLLLPEYLHERLEYVLECKNQILTKVYDAAPISLDEIYETCLKWGKELAPNIKETTHIIEEAISQDKKIIMEGAQGALLDPDFGTYPYGTSSSPLAAGGCLGIGIGPASVSATLGVFKAYSTRVGGGPMPTELLDKTGDIIRDEAHEYGTTTGRPRRIGWFDAVAGRFSCQINGMTTAIMTRLDIMDILPAISICTAYELNGKIIKYFPANSGELAKCKPVYEEMPGWLCSTKEVRCYDDLPLAAKNYICRIEELIGCQMSAVCIGPSREQTIYK